MSLTSKSPKQVAVVALAVGKASLPDYSHRFSSPTYTQPQLFACLVLKVFLKLDYRGIEQHRRDLPTCAQGQGLTRIPDHSTLHQAAQRCFGQPRTEKLLDAAVRLCLRRRKRVCRSALDASGPAQPVPEPVTGVMLLLLLGGVARMTQRGARGAATVPPGRRHR